MASKRTAGERPETPVKPLKSAAELAADAAAVTEKFPDNFKDSLALLQQLNVEPCESGEDWQAKQPRLAALKKHVFAVQQGLPVIHSTGNDNVEGREARRQGEQRTKLELLARQDADVKALLAKHDALEKELAGMKSAIGAN